MWTTSYRIREPIQQYLGVKRTCLFWKVSFLKNKGCIHGGQWTLAVISPWQLVFYSFNPPLITIDTLEMEFWADHFVVCGGLVKIINDLNLYLNLKSGVNDCRQKMQDRLCRYPILLCPVTVT